MKPLPFTIPSTDQLSFYIQHDVQEGFYPILHQHEEIQICWIQKGQGNLFVNTEIFPFQSDDIFIIASNQAHLFKEGVEKMKISALSLFFSLNPEKNKLVLLPELVNLFSRFSKMHSCLKLKKEIRIRAAKFLNTIARDKEIDRIVHFLELLNHLKPSIKEMEQMSFAPASSEGKMKTIMEFTINNLHEDIQISKVAKLVNYSDESFCRFFKKRTRITYIDYLNRLRINAACNQMLHRRGFTISEIAYSCGFNHVTHFNRVFRQIKNCSPTEYLKRRT